MGQSGSPEDASEDGEASEEDSELRPRHLHYHCLGGGICLGALGALLLVAVVLPALGTGYLVIEGRSRLPDSLTRDSDVKRWMLDRDRWRAAFKGDRSTPDPFTLAGKSIYFLIIDRFARAGAGASYPSCTGVSPRFCGGNIRGIIDHLDYIQGMGFDCVWITPPVKQFASDGCHVWQSKRWCRDAFSGYWTGNFFEIDSHFGTREDLRDLSDSLHSRKMCLVLDMVVNHAGIITSDADAKRIFPFDKMEYYHQLAGPESFDQVQCP